MYPHSGAHILRGAPWPDQCKTARHSPNHFRSDSSKGLSLVSWAGFSDEELFNPLIALLLEWLASFWRMAGRYINMIDQTPVFCSAEHNTKHLKDNYDQNTKAIP